MDKRNKIIKLVKKLNEASKAYYKEDVEIMSNLQYDKLYEELENLEKETGIVLSNSPTQKVGYEILESLPKEAHKSRMLSLDKTKEVAQLESWLGNQKGLLSWKLDGLTVVLTYENGQLVKAVTRGNGEVGEVVTSNAKVFENVPVSIPFNSGTLTLRGEAFIKYSDFEQINRDISEVDAKYKNPRNLCSGSVRQLNTEVTAKRKVNFAAFSLSEITGENLPDFENSRMSQLRWLQSQGFEVVDFFQVTSADIAKRVKWFEKEIEHMDIPSDGLVLLLDDIAYGESLGNTAKFPRNAIAFKWKDEIAETTLKEIEWSPSRTGLINPVAIFEPVELEGTTVTRASVHNISILKELKLGIGDKITVYKANMIIPQISENLTGTSNVKIPDKCPVCGGDVVIKNDNGVETLVCINPNCPVKKIKSFSLFVSRDAMNIENLSEATLEKFIAHGFIRQYTDLFTLDNFRDEIISMEGFGEKSYENLIAATKKASVTTPARLLYALGISGIGVANAKVIAKAAGQNWEKIMNLTEDELLAIDGIGEVMAKAVVSFFAHEENREMLTKLLDEISFEEVEVSTEVATMEGKIFVITGSLNHFDNRNQLKEEIEKRGGKVTGSVSSKTDYLINNDKMSASSKNKKAKELEIPIISEEDFLDMIN